MTKSQQHCIGVMRAELLKLSFLLLKNFTLS